MEERSGLGIAGFVIGLVLIFLFWIPVLGVLLGILGIVFSIMGIKRSKKRGLAIAGLVLSIIGLLLAIVVTIFMIIAMIYIGQAVSNFSFMMKTSNYTVTECQQACNFIDSGNESCVSGCNGGNLDVYVNSLKSSADDSSLSK